jgi:transposase, IS6 family
VIKAGRLSPLISYWESTVAESDPFKWRHYQDEIILLSVRWYLRYALSYRDLEEIMGERGLSVDHTTIYRWVQRYGPELEKRVRPLLRPTNDSYCVDETYIKIKGRWYYLYRAVDSAGQTIDFMLSAKRDARAASRFFRKMLIAPQHSSPRVINVDKNQAYPPAIEELKEEGMLADGCQLRQCKYLNNIVEQDHRFIKRRVNPGLGFFSFKTARRTIMGYETMLRVRKGQVKGVGREDIQGQVKFVESLFLVAA